ncbi:MAG: AbrB/MazE/SpoVT family DNA-binding domain-containing protein [Sphingomonadales bacterium]
MQSALRKIGNSTGLVLPKHILGAMGVAGGTMLDLKVEDGRLIATPVKTKVREGWAEAAALVAAAEEDPDEAAWRAFGNESDEDWEW